MSDRLQWFRWNPGAMPQLDKVPLSVRGAAHALMDALWLNPELESWDLVKLLDHLMIELNHLDVDILSRIMPPIHLYLSRERGEGEAWRDKKRTAGRLGGLAKASNATSTLANLPPTYLPTKLPKEPKEKRACPKQASDPSPAVMEIPCVGNGPKTWTLHQAKVDEWISSFPGLDVMGEVRRAAQWLRDNPTKAKTANGMPAFFSRWLSRATDSPATGRTPAPAARKRTWESDEAFKTQLSGYKVPVLGETE